MPQVPCTGIFLSPSKSGKTVALISMIQKIYIFSPSVNIDDGWIPVKKDLGVNTEREQAYYDKWDEAGQSGGRHAVQDNAEERRGHHSGDRL